MSIEELVSQQPEAVSSSGADQGNAGVQEYGDNADTTPVNVSSIKASKDDKGVDEGQKPEDNLELDNLKERTKRRFQDVVGERNQLRDEVNELRATLESIQAKQNNSQPQTLRDLSVEQLNSLIRNEEYEEFHEEARQIRDEKIVEKKLEEKLSAKEAEQQKQVATQLSFQIAEAYAGDYANDPEGEVFKLAEQKLNMMDDPQYANVDWRPAFAFALARQELGVDAQQKPTLVQQVRGRKNRIEAPSKASPGDVGNLANILANSKGRLGVSPQGRQGSLRGAIKELGIMKSFTQ